MWKRGVTSGAGGLIRPHPKPTPGGPQGFTRLIASHPGGVAPGRPRGRLEHIQDPNLTRARLRQSQYHKSVCSRALYELPRAARLWGICNANKSNQGKFILILTSCPSIVQLDCASVRHWNYAAISFDFLSWSDFKSETETNVGFFIRNHTGHIT